MKKSTEWLLTDLHIISTQKVSEFWKNIYKRWWNANLIQCLKKSFLVNFMKSGCQFATWNCHIHNYKRNSHLYIYNKTSHVHNVLQKIQPVHYSLKYSSHVHNCNRHSHLHHFNKNCHPHICCIKFHRLNCCWNLQLHNCNRNSHLHNCYRKIHQRNCS